MTILPLIPQQLPGGMVVEVFPAAPEVGGFDLTIWKNRTREDGLMFCGLPDLRAVRRLISLAMEAAHG